jgi:hypothetical protein
MKAVVRRGLALVTVALLAAACTSGGPAAKATTTTTTTAKGTTPTTTTLPSLVANVTPVGWVPVDYGGAQISVPADWNVSYDACPVAQQPGSEFVGATSAYCPFAGALPGVPEVFLHSVPAGGSTVGNAETVNGIVVRRTYRSRDESRYVVPSLGVSVTLSGAAAQRVLSTLTYSPRAVVVEGQAASAVPSSWHLFTFAGVSFAAPSSWPRETIDTYGPGCSTPGILFGSPSVTLSSDKQLVVYYCPVQVGPARVEPAADGVRVDAIPSTAVPTPNGLASHCLAIHGLTVCPYAQPAFGILYLRVSGPRVPHAVMFELGLAGDGTVARTILGSLSPAQPLMPTGP